MLAAVLPFAFLLFNPGTACRKEASGPSGCFLSDGTHQPNGWSGPGAGFNFCNKCSCQNNNLLCSRLRCPSGRRLIEEECDECCRMGCGSHGDPELCAKMGCGRRRLEADELEPPQPITQPPQTTTTKQRLDGRNYTLTFDDLQLHDPLCEWILNDGLDSDWTMLSQENRNYERELLLAECEEVFETPANIAQCKFYVYATENYFTTDELIESLKFDPEAETSVSKYQRCGKLTVWLNEAIEGGELNGIRIVQKEEEDGTTEDYFEFDEPAFDEDEPKLKTKSVFETMGRNAPIPDVTDLALQSAVTIGSVLSWLLGSTLVKVCRDFNPTDYTWMF